MPGLALGFLGRFAQCGGDDVGVGFFAVSAELQPAAEPRMQCQQCTGAGVVEDERGAGDMAGYVLAQTAVGPCGKECQQCVPQRVLRGIWCAPTRQRRDS